MVVHSLSSYLVAGSYVPIDVSASYDVPRRYRGHWRLKLWFADRAACLRWHPLWNATAR